MHRPSLTAAIALAVTAGGCGGGSDGQLAQEAPLAVSAIGGKARPGDPGDGPLDTPQRLMMDATAQGLVRFDGAGQIEPGLAERWIVMDEGRSYIFRLRESYWPDGQRVTADQVVRVLRRAATPNSKNPLAPFLAVIDEIVEMTPEVIEVRLRRPRPDLLKLLAQPELAVFGNRTMGGGGPLRATREPGGSMLLRPVPDPARLADEESAPLPERSVRLRGERAAMAIARFEAGAADLVLGGSFADWPIVTVANVPDEAVRIDPATGMFGFAIASREGFLADAANRAALAMAIDRNAIVQAFRPDWLPLETLLPAQLDSARAPAVPSWGPLPLEARRENARARVLAWRSTNPGPLVIRIALPPGPGANLLWNATALSLLSVGIRPQRVAPDERAELRLVDAVAPYDSGRWFLVTACQPCGAEALDQVTAAREAVTLAERAERIAEADAALTADAAWIPVAQPLRWSIVTTRVTGWQGNPRAWHPLNHLRNE